MPADVLGWSTYVMVERSPSYSGTGRVLLENVTKGETLLDRSSFTLFSSELVGKTGDMLRLSVDAVGSGSHPAGVPGFSKFGLSFFMEFRVPEPSTLVLLVMGVGVVMRQSKVRFLRRIQMGKSVCE